MVHQYALRNIVVDPILKNEVVKFIQHILVPFMFCMLVHQTPWRRGVLIVGPVCNSETESDLEADVGVP
jgi:hypothetical protein